MDWLRCHSSFALPFLLKLCQLFIKWNVTIRGPTFGCRAVLMGRHFFSTTQVEIDDDLTCILKKIGRAKSHQTFFPRVGQFFPSFPYGFQKLPEITHIFYSKQFWRNSTNGQTKSISSVGLAASLDWCLQFKLTVTGCCAHCISPTCGCVEWIQIADYTSLRSKSHSNLADWTRHSPRDVAENFTGFNLV